MRRCTMIIALFIFAIGFSQTNPDETKDIGLTQNYKVEIGTRGVNVNYEYPVSENLLLDAGIGYGFVTTFNGNLENLAQHFINNGTPFAMAKLNYFINRERRLQKNRRMENNSGTYFGFQSKYTPNKWENIFGQVLLNQVHFGQQLSFDKHWSFNYHLGMGYAVNLTSGYSKYNGYYPTLGFGISIYP